LTPSYCMLVRMRCSQQGPGSTVFTVDYVFIYRYVSLSKEGVKDPDLADVQSPIESKPVLGALGSPQSSRSHPSR